MLSNISKTALTTLGIMIKTARLERSLSQSDLGERLGVSRQTVMQLEKGHPSVGIGIAFEAAYILGIPLLTTDPSNLVHWQLLLKNFIALLPTRSGRKKIEIDDDF